MKLYNTKTRQLETFTPLDPQHVKIYTCGPTVYNFQHIGNYAAYIYWDLLIRLLSAHGWTPYRVLNLTDVGHLSSDGDTGEDKLEKGAKREGKTVWEIAQFYSDDFLRNFASLHLTPPAKIARATDYIKTSIALVDRLTQKGYTYETSDGIYFDTSKFPTYPDFAKIDLEKIKAGARVEFNPEKHNPADFALWKFIRPNEDHAMQWEYLGRMGYPGWHIECSTIIHAELGEPIDIHTGGIDHIPVHHTNEIAQSEAAFDTNFSRFWLHCNFITVEGQKISKSLGNTYTLDDLASRGFAPLDFKLWILQGHYQSLRNFSFDDLSAARTRRLHWRNQIAKLHQSDPHNREDQVTQPDRTLLDHILAALDQNLGSPAALALIDNANITTLATWSAIDQLFGLDLLSSAPKLTAAEQQLFNQRNQARANKDYATADALRHQLAAHNLTVLDTPSGPIWQYLH